MKNKKQSALAQFLKFAVVGVVNTAVDWVVFYLLVRMVTDIDRSTAKALSFLAAMLNSYLWNTIWTFKNEYTQVSKKSGAKSKIFLKFAFVSLIGWGVNVMTYNLASSDLHFTIVNSDFVPLVFASGAAILWNFFANKFWTYKK